MKEDGLTRIAGEVIRAEMGIRDDTRPVDKQLTPAEQATDDVFENRDSMSWLVGRKEEVKPLDPVVLELSKLSLQAYNRLHEEQRKRAGNTGNPRLDQQYENYGKHTQVVGKVGVSPAGPQGRWMVNFTTTHVQDEGDWRVTASTMIFDVQSERLDESYPARQAHWVVGERGGQREIIGNYKQLHEASNGKLTDSLQGQGWNNVGEIWAADVDRHAGFLTPPTK